MCAASAGYIRGAVLVVGVQMAVPELVDGDAGEGDLSVHGPRRLDLLEAAEHVVEHQQGRGKRQRSCLIEKVFQRYGAIVPISGSRLQTFPERLLTRPTRP